MAALPVHTQSPHEAEQPDVKTTSGVTDVKAVENHNSPKQIASPAHALQARIVAELSKPSGMSVRKILATLLVLSLSTWIAGFFLYAAL